MLRILDFMACSSMIFFSRIGSVIADRCVLFSTESDEVSLCSMIHDIFSCRISNMVVYFIRSSFMSPVRKDLNFCFSTRNCSFCSMRSTIFQIFAIDSEIVVPICGSGRPSFASLSHCSR